MYKCAGVSGGNGSPYLHPHLLQWDSQQGSLCKEMARRWSLSQLGWEKRIKVDVLKSGAFLCPEFYPLFLLAVGDGEVDVKLY